jgi:hypothetical protein
VKYQGEQVEKKMSRRGNRRIFFGGGGGQLGNRDHSSSKGRI